MANKIEIPLDVCTRLINHGPVSLLTSAYMDKRNVMALAWLMPVSHTPRYLAIALPQKRYSYELIEKSKEFVLNIPPVALKQLVLNCGEVTGRKVDKFKEHKIKTLPAKKVGAPLIEDCVAHLECKIINEIKAGDHQILVAEIVAASANEGVVSEKGIVNVEKAQMLHHLGGAYFGVMEKEV
ncbi:MAG: flavin reductase family protein [Candidatus Margulisbacteria bacterium]|nr:flavin reductase family protein [Candidatus Margulisiibacteriota bacterium]